MRVAASHEPIAPDGAELRGGLLRIRYAGRQQPKV